MILNEPNIQFGWDVTVERLRHSRPGVSEQLGSKRGVGRRTSENRLEHSLSSLGLTGVRLSVVVRSNGSHCGLGRYEIESGLEIQSITSQLLCHTYT